MAPQDKRDQEAAERFSWDLEKKYNPIELANMSTIVEKEAFIAGVEHARNNPVVSGIETTPRYRGDGEHSVNVLENMVKERDKYILNEHTKMQKVKEALEWIINMDIMLDKKQDPVVEKCNEILALLDGEGK